MWWGPHYGGRGGAAVLAQSAFDIALHDLKARRARLPLWKLLGGNDPAVPCYAGGIDLDLDVTALLKQTDQNLAKGFRAIKMKVGRERMSENIAKVASMRKHLGDGFPLMVDANMKWTASEAIKRARALQPYDLVWLEEPTIPDDVAGHACIAREGGIPIATGENFRTLWEFKHMIAAGCVSYPEPDVTNCGGATVFMKVAHLAEAHNLQVTSHGAHDVTVHLLAACPNRSYLEAHGFGLDRYIAEPLAIADSMATAPDTPGHGIEFDWKALAPGCPEGLCSICSLQNVVPPLSLLGAEHQQNLLWLGDVLDPIGDFGPSQRHPKQKGDASHHTVAGADAHALLGQMQLKEPGRANGAGTLPTSLAQPRDARRAHKKLLS